MSSVDKVCPKCGGKMMKGEVKFSAEQLSTRAPSPFSTGIPMGGLPSVMETVESRPYWEERTGEKTGFIFKRDEKRRMTVEGYRCTLCNFIELYAQER